MKIKISILAIIAASLLSPGVVVFAEPSSVAQLIGALKSTDEAARLRAIDQLGEAREKGADAVAPLVALLKDQSPKVRAHAARALGEIGAPAKPAVAALADLLKDPDETVRRQAIRAVMAIRPGPQVTVPLCVKLLEDADPGVRVRILHAISEVGPPAVPGLVAALKNEKAAYWALLILREIGPPAKDAVPAVAEKLGDPRPEIRREAVLTLGAMEDAAKSAAGQIATALDDEHARTAATYVLGRLGVIPAAAEAKVRANAKSDDKLLATTSLWALARVHPADKELLRETLQQLIERLKDEDPFVRVGAARALAALPPAPEIAAPIWEKAIQEADATTVEHALDALAALGAPAVPRLIDALKHKSSRTHVILILRRLGPAAAPATDALARLVGDMDERVSHEAVMALASIGPAAKSAVPALIQAMQREEGDSAHAVIYALGRIGPGAVAAEPALLKLLAHSKGELALVTAWALAQIHPTSPENAAKTVPLLIAGLADPTPLIRQGAAESLGALGPLAKEAAGALKKVASSDVDKSVRQEAAKSLNSIGRGPAKPAEGGVRKPSKPIKNR